MIVSLKLGPNMECEKICRKIQELINYYNKQNLKLDDSLLVLQIKHPLSDTSLIPKLEHKNIELQ